MRGLGGSTLAKVLVDSILFVFFCLLKVRATPGREAAYSCTDCVSPELLGCDRSVTGSKELACGSQAFIATLLFDPSMSALPIIPKQNSVSVGLFTH